MKKAVLFILGVLLVVLTGERRVQPQKRTYQYQPVDTTRLVENQIYRYLLSYNTSHVIYINHNTLHAIYALSDAYISNNFSPLWFNDDKLNSTADTLISILGNAQHYGLIPADYHYSYIHYLQNKLANFSSFVDTKNISQLDLLLSDAFFTFAVDLSKGRLNPNTLRREWKMKQVPKNLDSLLHRVLSEGNISQSLTALESPQPAYHRLEFALRRFLKKMQGHSWKMLPSPGTASFNTLLRQRLIASADYDTTWRGSENYLLKKAIRHFQEQHGLTADGIVGKHTYDALNISLKKRIQQVAVNLERWRWQPDSFPQRYLLLNIPSYTLTLIDDDTVYFVSKAVVGKADKQTPVINGVIHYFIIYPFWNVPKKIATEEMLPRIRKNVNYLSRHNMDVLNWNGDILDPTKIPWQKLDKTYFPYLIRQRAGTFNALGVVKFMFNNKYGVYLHDTNEKNLFDKDIRAYSHGCMRFQKARELAYYLIKDDSLRYTKDSLDLYFSRKKRKQINLRDPIPIYVKYFTCETDSTGHLVFYKDIYGKDAMMERALYKQQ